MVTAVAVALCSFWLLPAMLAGGAVHTVVQTSPIDTAISTFGQFSNPLLTVTMLAFPGDFYFHAIDRGAAFFFAAYGLLLGSNRYGSRDAPHAPADRSRRPVPADGDRAAGRKSHRRTGDHRRLPRAFAV